MKAHLMYPDRDFDPKASLPQETPALTQDLELNEIFQAMGGGDDFLREVARRGVLLSLTDPALIEYRQQILADCLQRPSTVRRTYAVAVEALRQQGTVWGWTSMWRSADSTLHRSLELMRLFVPLLRELRHIAESHREHFRSAGFIALWDMLCRELNEDYLHEVEDHLQRLKFSAGLTMSAALGAGNRGTQYVLREPPISRSWWERLKEWPEHWHDKPPPSYFYQVADRDEAGHQALTDLQRRGIARTAAALGRAADHVQNFFSMLRAELAFYIGCINLHEALKAQGQPVCAPEALSSNEVKFSAQGLYDVALALKVRKKIVANDVPADEKLLVMITGANRGGKSTMLRSMGQAQLMMQCGLFVGASSFSAGACLGLFTHFKREEDVTMRSGKLDEELKRMSEIVDRIRSHSLLLCNESFGATNEREGSEIGRQILRALLERRVKVFYVTHLFDLADSFCKARRSDTLFLRAERLPEGRRTFRIEPGEPLPTSYGQDLYRAIFFDKTAGALTGADQRVRDTVEG